MEVMPIEMTLKNKIWHLKLICPWCQKIVRHGGGNDPEPFGGPRACNNCSKPIRIVIHKSTQDSAEPLP